MKKRLFLLWSLSVGLAFANPDPGAFLQKFCIDCHGPEKQKGERRFDQIAFPLESELGVIEVQEIIDQLNLGEMPPSKAKQPGKDEKFRAIALLTQSVETARTALKHSGNQTVLRRLNEREYLNTLEHLLGRRVDTLAPTKKFPAEKTLENMDTVGDVLTTSGFLLDQYFESADLVIESSLKDSKKPEVKEWKFEKDFYQGQELSYSHKNVFNYKYLCVYEVPNTVNHEGGYAGLSEFPEGVHAAGFYEVRVLAQEKHRDTHYSKSILKMDLSEPFRLGIVTGDAKAGLIHHPQPIEPKLAEVTIRPGEPKWYTMKVWLEEGQSPRFIFPNGMANCRQAFGAIARKYKKDWPKKDPYKGGIVQARRIVLQHGKMPHIRIHKVHIKGPIFETWPPKHHQRVFGEEGFQEEMMKRIIRNFAHKAYRRTPKDEEIVRLMELTQSRIAKGKSPRQATLDAFKAILCSPSFLYLSEPSQKEGLLSAVDLASRLSYFMWALPPDYQLRQDAKSGDLLKKEVLEKQFNRLLNDPRAMEFAAGFSNSWLNLRALGDQPPDRSASGVYYYDDLENAMKKEIQRFMLSLLRKNGPVTDFLDSDYTFVNKPLAELYQLGIKFEPKNAHQFQRVALKDKRRGGLLGMGGVLTVSANGIETSPVTRGVWLLENLLGTPPPPPPDDVPAIDPDVRGAKSIRDQLNKHRNLETCAECHKKIDPPGFALENFDPIGRWRDRYHRGPKINASGIMSNGDEFKNVVEFKKLLLKRKDQFTHHLVDRVLTYATGRHISAMDRPDVDRITKKVIESNYGMRTLLREVVLSPTFRSR